MSVHCRTPHLFMRPALFFIIAVILALALPVGAEVYFTTTNAIWKALKGRAEASSPDATIWRQPSLNDSNWSNAPAPIYYTSTATEPPFYNGGPVTGTVL